jgi:hypothetical protein
MTIHAHAISFEPKVVIFDEPTANLSVTATNRLHTVGWQDYHRARHRRSAANGAAVWWLWWRPLKRPVAYAAMSLFIPEKK